MWAHRLQRRLNPALQNFLCLCVHNTHECAQQQQQQQQQQQTRSMHSLKDNATDSSSRTPWLCSACL
jgi:hypothetical protein